MIKYKFFYQAITILLIGFSFVGCNKTNDNNLCACEMQMPVKEIPWLLELKTNLEEDSEISSAMIVLYNWNGQDYFYVATTIPGLYDIPYTVYDCEGNEILRCGGNAQYDNCKGFFSESEEIDIVWEK